MRIVNPLRIGNFKHILHSQSPVVRFIQALGLASCLEFPDRTIRFRFFRSFSTIRGSVFSREKTEFLGFFGFEIKPFLARKL